MADHWTEKLFGEQAGLFAETFADRFDEADEEVAALLDLLDAEYNRDVERTLDVACGVGRHVLALAERGCRAEGLDFSAAYVERARNNARERGVADRTTFHHRDMRDLEVWEGPEEYDLATVLWNSLGYYGRETDRRVLAAVRERLADDGVLVVEVGNKDCHVAEPDHDGVSEGDGRLQVTRRTYDVTTGEFELTVDWFDATDDGYDHVDTMEWRYRMYAPVVLRELCLDAGFDAVDLYADFDGTELTVDAPEVVLVAR